MIIKRQSTAMIGADGVLRTDAADVSDILAEHWKGIMKGTGKTVGQCEDYIRKYGAEERWKKLTHHLWKEPTEDMVRNALEKMDPNLAPGIDGVPAYIYQ